MSDYRGAPELPPDDPGSIEFSALVAERLMGWKTIMYEEWPGSLVPLLWHAKDGTPRGRDFGRLADGRWVPWDIPQYGRDIAAAWQVWELPQHDGWVMQRWFQDVWHYAIADGAVDFEADDMLATATDAPHCICLAALRFAGLDGAG